MISLLRYYRWNKFSILYEESWVTVALTLENHAKKNNMTVNHQRPVIDGFKCCEEKMTCCAPGFWYQFIQETKNRTRSEYYSASDNLTCGYLWSHSLSIVSHILNPFKDKCLCQRGGLFNAVFIVFTNHEILMSRLLIHVFTWINICMFRGNLK